MKEGKGKKDRYIPLADILIRGLKSYLEAKQPNEWVFNSKDQEIVGRVGGDFDSCNSQRGVQWAVHEVKKKAGIVKRPFGHPLKAYWNTSVDTLTKWQYPITGIWI